MKNLLLLLVLSLFSIQSFAGSCPDGSEPIKSISADGTYFVFNCGGQSSSGSGLVKSSDISFPGNFYTKEIEFLCSISNPTHGAITNIGAAHLEGFGDIQGVINTKNELEQYFESKQKYFQTDFYTQQRKKLNILIDKDGKPEGGKWSYDADNSLKYPKDKTIVETR